MFACIFWGISSIIVLEDLNINIEHLGLGIVNLNGWFTWDVVYQFFGKSQRVWTCDKTDSRLISRFQFA